MKQFKISLVLIAFLAIACSKEDDPAPPSLEEATLNFAENQQVLEVPQGLQDSDDPYAELVEEWITSVNTISSYYHYFDVPEGAQKLSSPISVSSGRVAATTEEYLVYTWELGELAIAYQVHSEGEYYIFEIFIDWEGEGWSPYLYAKQHKTKYEGNMKVYWGDGSDDLIAEYDWHQDGDMLYLNANLFGTYHWQFAYNQKTGAGSVDAYSDSDLIYQIEWDGDGNGTYVYYDYDGEVLESGTWDV